MKRSVSCGGLTSSACSVPGLSPPTAHPHAEQPRTLAERERQAIIDTLQRTSGRLAEAARRLGISRTTLWRRLKAYGLRPGNGRVGSASRA